MTCPFCGGQMQSGQITGDGRSKVRFYKEGQLPTKLDRAFADPWQGRLTAARYEPFTGFWIDSHYCPACRKMIFETDIE